MRWFRFDGKWFERNSLVLLVSLSIVSMAFVLGPMPDFFLLNHEEMQCASMSEGDEFSSYAPPQHWEIAKPDSAGFIQTKYGSCNYYEVINSKDCCQKLGYTYIGWIEGEKRISLHTIVFALYMIGFPFVMVFLIYFLPVFLFRKLVEYVSKKQETTGEKNVSRN